MPECMASTTTNWIEPENITTDVNGGIQKSYPKEDVYIPKLSPINKKEIKIRIVIGKTFFKFFSSLPSLKLISKHYNMLKIFKSILFLYIFHKLLIIF